MGGEKVKIAVIGGGLAGLNAGRLLSEYAHVDVFEPSSPGGLAGSYCTENYCIEAFYHHFFRQDSYLLEVIRELKLENKVVWKITRVGQEYGRRIYPLNTPLEILRYPGMNFIDKFRLAKFTLSAKRKDYKLYDEVGVLDGLKEDVGESLIEKFFLLLLKSKFGENYRDVSYAWLLARVTLRGNRKLSGEELGYLRGGFHQLVKRLSENLNIIQEKARIKKGTKWDVNGAEYDAVVYTAPIPELKNMGIDFNLAEVKYQSSICLLLGMKGSYTDDLYWINYQDAPFGATIEHTNFMPLEDYGEHLLYVASYTTPEKIGLQSDEEIFRLYVKSLDKFGLNEREIKWWKVFRAKYSGPVYEKGYRKNVTPYRIHDGFYVAGMTSDTNYPERSMNGSLMAGKNVAEKILSEFALL